MNKFRLNKMEEYMSNLTIAVVFMIAITVVECLLYSLWNCRNGMKTVYGKDGTEYLVPKVFKFGAKCCIGGIKMITVIGRNGAEFLIPRNFTFRRR